MDLKVSVCVYMYIFMCVHLCMYMYAYECACVFAQENVCGCVCNFFFTNVSKILAKCEIHGCHFVTFLT